MRLDTKKRSRLSELPYLQAAGELPGTLAGSCPPNLWPSQPQSRKKLWTTKTNANKRGEHEMRHAHWTDTIRVLSCQSYNQSHLSHKFFHTENAMLKEHHSNTKNMFDSSSLAFDRKRETSNRKSISVVPQDDVVTREITEKARAAHTIGNTGVSHGHTDVRFCSRPFDRCINSVTRVLSRPLQALVSRLGADVRHAPHCPQKTILRNNHDSRLSCTTPLPSTIRFTRCSSGRLDLTTPLPLVCEGTLFLVAPPWPKESSSSLLLSVTADGAWQVRAATHPSPCRPSTGEHVVCSCFHVGRLLALPHTAHWKIILLLIACQTLKRLASLQLLRFPVDQCARR